MGTLDNGARQNVQDIGMLLRFVTPILLAVVGYLTIDKLNHINETTQNQGQKLEALQRQVDRLEAVSYQVQRNQLRIDGHAKRLREIEQIGNHLNETR